LESLKLQVFIDLRSIDVLDKAVARWINNLKGEGENFAFLVVSQLLNKLIKLNSYHRVESPALLL
jgi:hypothetical protein